MVRRNIILTLLVVMCCTSLAWGESPEYYLVPGRENLFDGTLSGVQEAYQIFTEGINDPACSDNEVIRFFHAAAGTVVLVCKDDGVPINSFFELARAFGIEVLGDNWHQLAVYHPVNEHDAYEIPPGAPDADEIRIIFDSSMIPQVVLLIDDLKLISPPFEILLVPEETSVFFGPASPGLQYDLEIDYAEVLLLKGLLVALKAQLQAKSAYDLYVDPDNNLIEKLQNNAFNMNTDLLDPYPNILKVAPTTNNPENGTQILDDARQDLIVAIDYYFEAINHIRSETDPQENDFLYIDQNAEPGFQLVDDRLTTLRNSLVDNTAGTYMWETTKKYDIYMTGPGLIGELVLVYDFTGFNGDHGSLTFTDPVIAPTPWEVRGFWKEHIGQTILIEVDVEYYSNGDWRQGFLKGTLISNEDTIVSATFDYWGAVSDNLTGLWGTRTSTEVTNRDVNLNPIFVAPGPVSPRDLLPELDEWNMPLPNTMGHGLGNDPTLGGILPGMSQYDWQVLLGMQPEGLPIISFSTAINIDGSINEWTPAQIVLTDISGDTEETPPMPGVDIDKLYMAYDSQNLYGAITLYENIDSYGYEYGYGLVLSYSPDDWEALGSILLVVNVYNGNVEGSLYYIDLSDGYLYPNYIANFNAVSGSNTIEFNVPLADIAGIPADLAGRFITVASFGSEQDFYGIEDEDWNETHLKIAGLGTNELGTISGTVSYEDFSGAPIFVQAYIDPWDPEGSIIASTMITGPGSYTLEGIGIGWKGYVRAFTSLFGFNVFDLDALTIEASTSVTLTSSAMSGVDLVLGQPATLPEDTWVQGQIDIDTYEKFYAFEAQKGNVYALDLARGTTFACMTLYGRDGHTELEQRYSGKWQHIDWICPETGTYYIRVSNYQPLDGEGTYQLRIALQDSMPSGYEVWGGSTNYTIQPDWWEYYYNIDKQNYVKLGESTGGSATFDGNYTYYVIATHEPIAIDCVSGPNAQYYYGIPQWTGNTLNPNNIRLAPDDQYATVGYWGPVDSTFEGFVIIDNPGNWDSLSVITADTGSISGKVVKHNDESGMANVRVDLYTGDDENIADEDAWNHKGTTYTDSNGEYKFDFLPQRRYRIRIPDWEVSGEHYFEANLYNVQVNEGAETPNINPSLRQAGLIYGYVRTNTNEPIENAYVVANAAWTEHGPDWHNAWTNSEGRYEFWVAPSPGKFYPIWVREAFRDGTNYASEWDGNFYRATLAADTQVPDYILEPGGTATGFVVNENGAGIEGVRIEGAWNKYGKYIGPQADTGLNGYFSLGGLPTGINYICLNNNWREIQQNGVKYMVGEAYAGPLNISSGQTIVVGIFTIYEAGMVTGVVTDESGFGIVDVSVEVGGQDIEGNEAWREDVVTDSLGQFTLDYVAPGTYFLRCSKDGIPITVETDIRVTRGGHVDIDVVLIDAAEGAIISGSITNYSDVAAHDSDGVPLPYYGQGDYEKFGLPSFGFVAFSMEHDYTERDYLDIEKNFVGFLNASDIEDGYGNYFEPNANETPGNYETSLPPGDIAVGMYTYQDYLPGRGGGAILYDWKRFNLSKGDVRNNVDFTAVTTNTGTLKGDILVPSEYDDYLPKDWCCIYAYALDADDNIKSAIPLGDAIAFVGWPPPKYELRGLPAGNYMLRAYARNLPSVTIPLVTVNGGTTIQNIDFTSSPSGTLTGQVTDGISDINNAVVTIVENGRQAVTDDSGNYIFAGINTGTYTVMVTSLGYADAQDSIIIGTGSTTLDFTLDSNVGSISGTVKDAVNNNVNGATVLAYNETNDTHKTTQTVAGVFTIAGLTPGQYILAVDTEDYGVVVYPEGSNRITLAANQDIPGINIIVGTPEPPLFTVTSSVSDTVPAVLSMEFYSDQGLAAAPAVTIKDENNVSGTLNSTIPNNALNRFNTTYTYTASSPDAMVLIGIEGTSTQGIFGSRTFTFEVGKNLVMTSSTNVTNAIGGSTCIMGTQDNTEVYVPPFAIAGVEDTQAVALTIERYGDPGDAVTGTSDSTVSAVYDFEFDDTGITIRSGHTFTVTMSFQLPAGMTQQQFEDTLELRYFDADEQKWVTDTEHITNVRINWLNWTIMFEVSHLSKFAAFVPGDGIIGDFCGANFGQPDGCVDVWDLMQFADHWHTDTGDTNWDPKFDLAGPSFGEPDGYIDVWDLMLFADHWHEGQQP